jgi:RNA-directed DNA polymerase
VSQTVSTKLQRIAEQAVYKDGWVFRSLGRQIDVEFLREAHRRVRKNASPGVDGVTAEEYAENLEANLEDLHARMRSGLYKAPPGKRGWVPKDGKKRRPIGKPAFEDKIAQRAVVMLMEPIYEEVFYDFSYGFLRGRNAHQALKNLREQCRKLKINWIVDADVEDYFGSIDRGILREFIKRKVEDGSILRLIGKWLNAGVMEDDVLRYPERGTPQGGVISPLLSNIYLHYVLDEWYVKEVRPRLKGESFLVRFGDDFVIGCELEEDARKLEEVLPKRFERYKLTIHPEKTALVRFGKPREDEDDSGNGTFDFLGFTHYWTKSRRGYWVIKRKTARKRLRRAMRRIYYWCSSNRHEKLKDQYKMLILKLRGYYQYYGIRANYKMLEVFYEHVLQAWRYWLGRRTRNGYISCERFERLLQLHPLPLPRIVHNV